MKLCSTLVLLLLGACARDAQRSVPAASEPIASAPAVVPSEPGRAPEPASEAPAAQSVTLLDVTLQRSKVVIASEPVQKLDLAKSVELRPAGAAVPSDGVPTVTMLEQPLRVGLRVPAAHVLNVALDGFTPRQAERDAGRAGLTLGSLVPELTSLKPGTHRLTWFVSDQQGRVMHREGGTPLASALVFDFRPADAAGATARSAGAAELPLVLSPRGTFNAKDATLPVPLCVWHPDSEQALLLRIERRDGARAFLKLVRGSYELSGLGSGEYDLSIAADGAERGVDWSITVNRELDPTLAVGASSQGR